MPILNINLLQQQQTKLTRLNQANVVVGVVVRAIIGLELLIFVFLLSTGLIRAAQKNKVISDRQNYQRQIGNLDKQSSDSYPGLNLTQQIRALQGQVVAANTLVDNHKYFTLYLSE